MSDAPPPPPPPPASSPGSSGESLRVGEAASYAWMKFQQYPGPLILIAAIIGAVNLIGFVLRLGVKSVPVALVLQLLFFIVGQILTIGVINASLMVTAGQTPEPGRAFSTDKLGPFIVGSLLYGLAVVVGLILCVIPGLILAVLLGFYGFYILDAGMAPVDALKASSAAVRQHGGGVVLVLIVAFLINLLGAILCGIGLLITAPICWLMFAYAYRKINGQPVAA